MARTFQDLHDFIGSPTDGANPMESLILIEGSSMGWHGLEVHLELHLGMELLFSCNTDGSNYQDLHDFTGPGGANPLGSLILDSGVLYGMTSGGGAIGNNGIIFSCNIDGSNFRDLHDFAGSPTDGAGPIGSLILDNGVLYGMTSAGGANLSQGIIFSCNTDGSNSGPARFHWPRRRSSPWLASPG